MVRLTLDELELNAITAALDERVQTMTAHRTSLVAQPESPDREFALACVEDAIKYALRVSLAIAEAIDEPEYPADMTTADLFAGTRCCGASDDTPHWSSCRERLRVNDPSSYWHLELDR